MSKIVFILADGREIIANASVGANVMRTATTNGIPGIVAECGGAAMCATCHVYIDPASASSLPPKSEMEEEMLESAAAERTEFSRLSCQITVPDGVDQLVVHVPATQR